MSDEIQAFDEQEFDEAMSEAKAECTTAYVHHFKRPFVFEGKTYEKLTFDFEKLIGKDSLNVEAELQAKGIMVMVPTFSGPYLIRIAARACKEGIGSDALEQMRIADYNKIRSKARNFLLASEQ